MLEIARDWQLCLALFIVVSEVKGEPESFFTMAASGSKNAGIFEQLCLLDVYCCRIQNPSFVRDVMIAPLNFQQEGSCMMIAFSDPQTESCY